MRYLTTGGGYVTAANKAAAEALAAQFGLGAIVDVAPAPVKARPLRPVGVWDDLCQTWRVDPTKNYLTLAHKMIEGRYGIRWLAAVARTRDGWRPAELNAAERAAMLDAERAVLEEAEAHV